MIRSAPLGLDVALLPAALFCAAAAGLVLVGGAPRSRSVAGLSADGARVPVEFGVERRAPCPQPAPARASVPLPRGAPESARSAPARRGAERAYLAAFLAREREQPGALLASAETVLGGTGPAPEKVALLRALEAQHPAQAVVWLEHCVRSLPDESGPHADSLPSFALRDLARLGARDAAARTALGRLAFDELSLALPLRRRAAAAFAELCPGAELELLRVRLTRERDDLLVDGALAALAPRGDEPGVRRVLDAWPPRKPQDE